jgi:hypothetical protein
MSNETSANMGLLLRWLTEEPSPAVILFSFVRAGRSSLIFCTYLRLWVRYSADVRAEGTLNTSAAASPEPLCGI